MKVFVSSRSFGIFCKEAIEKISQVAEIDRSTSNSPMTELELAKILPHYDGIIVGTDKITKKVLENANKLKVVAKHGAGVDNIDLDACTKRNIVVTYVPSVNADSVADFAVCLMLSLARKLIPAHISTKRRKWKPKEFIGTEIHGKVIGIIGLGAVGSRVARRARGFNMKILYYDVCRKEELEKELGMEFVDLHNLLRNSDLITLHCPLTPHTRGMISKKEFDLMKDSAFLINTARGPIVDDKAAYEALRDRKIAGAAFDVYAMEPPRKSWSLFELDNVIVTPHIASYTMDAIRRVDLIQSQDVVRILCGEAPKFVANPEVLKRFYNKQSIKE